MSSLSRIIIEPRSLIFGPTNRRQSITITNHSDSKIWFEIQAHSLPGKGRVVRGDRPNGLINSGEKEIIHFEFKGEVGDDGHPILVILTDSETNKTATIKVKYRFDEHEGLAELAQMQSAYERLNDEDVELTDYPVAGLPNFIHEVTSRRRMSMIIFLFSLINFLYALYITLLNPVDNHWAQLLVQHNLHDISMKCSSWLEVHKVIHNLTCKIH